MLIMSQGSKNKKARIGRAFSNCKHQENVQQRAVLTLLTRC
jgi:hypothetical protein